ncbi:MFS transporter [Amycolatopsis methanolica]|nr:MFS transporter [Amycolatopsis methanolica]
MAMAYTLIGLVYPERLHASMFALLSSAWTIPSLAGPVVAAAVASSAGWRWVFLAMIPLAGVAGWCTLPGLARPAATTLRSSRWRPLVSSTALAAGTAILLAVLELRAVAVLVPLASAGFALAILALRQVTLAGTLVVRRGVPAGVVVRFLLCAVYFGTGAFLPLGLTELRHVSAFEAGLGLSAGALSWVAGSAAQANWDRNRRMAVGLGFAVLVAEVAVLAYGVLVGPGLLAALGWVIGGAGMGVAFNAATTETLGRAPTSNRARSARRSSWRRPWPRLSRVDSVAHRGGRRGTGGVPRGPRRDRGTRTRGRPRGEADYRVTQISHTRSLPRCAPLY